MLVPGPDDPSDPSTHTILIDDVDEEDDVYFPEDYSGEYPLDNDDADTDC